MTNTAYIITMLAVSLASYFGGYVAGYRNGKEDGINSERRKHHAAMEQRGTASPSQWTVQEQGGDA